MVGTREDHRRNPEVLGSVYGRQLLWSTTAPTARGRLVKCSVDWLKREKGGGDPRQDAILDVPRLRLDGDGDTLYNRYHLLCLEGCPERQRAIVFIQTQDGFRSTGSWLETEKVHIDSRKTMSSLLPASSPWRRTDRPLQLVSAPPESVSGAACRGPGDLKTPAIRFGAEWRGGGTMEAPASRSSNAQRAQWRRDAASTKTSND